MIYRVSPGTFLGPFWHFELIWERRGLPEFFELKTFKGGEGGGVKNTLYKRLEKSDKRKLNQDRNI